MRSLQSTYRLVHEQGFLPIFTDDAFDSRLLVEACVLAGCRTIEYTLRRRDAHIMIPWIRQQYPDLRLLVGSTLDGDPLVHHARILHPQLLALDELAEIGVDGFVSFVGFRPETIARYASSQLIIAPVSTMSEAHIAITAGAHFTKVIGPNLNLVSTLRNDATFGFCPIMVTGGMTLERIPEATQAGAVLCGAGFDLILNGASLVSSAQHVAEILAKYIDTTQRARDLKWPELARNRDADFASWAAALPHYHPL
jgi:2-keto-3-deoxy-6-phosphogluconate aldolase